MSYVLANEYNNLILLVLSVLFHESCFHRAISNVILGFRIVKLFPCLLCQCKLHSYSRPPVISLHKYTFAALTLVCGPQQYLKCRQIATVVIANTFFFEETVINSFMFSWV